MVILLALAGLGIGASVVLSGANTLTAFIGIGSVLVAGFGIVISPWLARRSARGGIACTVAGLAAVAVAAVLLLTSPASNSDLWVLINLGRFGGALAAALGLALTLHAAVLRTLGPSRALGLIAADVVALGVAVVIAGWETRS